MTHSRWPDVRERMRQAWEAEQARRATLTPAEAAAEEAERQRRRDALAEMAAIQEDNE